MCSYEIGPKSNYFNNLLFIKFSTMGKIIENYALQEIIGEGMYGKVYKAIHLKNKEEFAVKVIPVLKFQQNPKLQECTVNQINILSTIQTSPYIIRYVQMLKTPNNFYFIYEYCNGKTLESLLKQEGKLSESRALKIFKQLIEAFKVLNKYNIMHRDLKPDNIFFHNNNLKLGDFGFCKTLNKANDMASTMLGSPIYMAPQVLKGEIYTSKADIWSLGVVLYEMLFGFCPFQSNSIAKLISVLAESELKLPLQINNISIATQNLLKKLLVKDQFKRIDWLQLLQYSISEDGQISEKKSVNSKLDEFGLLVQKEGNKYLNDSLTNDYNGIKKNDNNNSLTTTLYTNSNTKIGNNNLNISSGNLNTQNNNYTNNSSFNKKVKNPKNFGQQTKQNQIHQYQNAHHNSVTPKKNIGFTPEPSNNGQNTYTTQFRRQSQNNQTLGSRRKKILEEHSLCINAIKTAIHLIKSEQSSGLVYAYILFSKVQERLKRMINEIGISDFELEDINLSVSLQIKQIQRQVIELKQELFQNSFDLNELKDVKSYLKSKFRDKNQPNLKQWYDMVVFIQDSKTGLLSRDLTILELTIAINNNLS